VDAKVGLDPGKLIPSGKVSFQRSGGHEDGECSTT